MCRGLRTVNSKPDAMAMNVVVARSVTIHNTAAVYVHAGSYKLDQAANYQHHRGGVLI